MGVHPGHPAHSRHYDHVEVEVHGGLTYGRLDGHGIYWLGFDCAHAYDRLPALRDKPSFPRSHRCHYHTMEEVKAEVEHLAKQLLEMLHNVN